MYQIIGAVAGGILGGFQASTAAKANNRAIAKNFEETVKALSTNYNYDVLKSRIGIQSEFDEARRTLLNLTFNSRQNQSTIRAAIAETGTEGRSVGKIEQAVEAHDLRTESSIKENSQIVTANYLRQMEADRLTTISQMEAAKVQGENSMISDQEQLFSMLTNSMKGATIGYSFGSMFGGGGGGGGGGGANVGATAARGSSTGTGGGFNMGGGKVTGL